MDEKRTWIIIDLKTSRAIYGLNNVTMRFSKREIAQEVADCLFKEGMPYVITQIFD